METFLPEKKKERKKHPQPTQKGGLFGQTETLSRLFHPSREGKLNFVRWADNQIVTTQGSVKRPQLERTEK